MTVGVQVAGETGVSHEVKVEMTVLGTHVVSPATPETEDHSAQLLVASRGFTGLALARML